MVVLLALVLAILPLAGAEPDSQGVPFRLYTVFQIEPAASIQQSMQDEVDAIMSPLGWKFQWKSLYADTGLTSIKQATLFFKGACGTGDLTEFPAYPFVLGRTEMTERNIKPFADIYCDAIRAYLARDLRARSPEDRGAAFGRAVGRVVAHELYHIFANTRHHASRGLGKAVCKPQELLADDFEFEKNEAVQLRLEALRALQDVALGKSARRSLSRAAASDVPGPKKGTIDSSLGLGSTKNAISSPSQ